MKLWVKKELAIVMALLMCLLPAFSLAEDTDIVPGTMLNHLVEAAIENGREVYGDFGMRFTGMESADLDAEELAVIQAMFDLVSSGSVTFAFASTPDEGYAKLGFAMQGEQVADVDVQLLPEGVRLTTSLMPTRVFDVRYDDLTQMLGLSDVDWAQVGDMVLSELTRYGDIAMNWLAGIPAPAEGGAEAATKTRGAAATSTTITITEEKSCELIVALLEEAKGDDILKSLATLEPDETWEGEIEKLIAEVKDELDGDDALQIRLLMDADGGLVALYIEEDEYVVALETKTSEEGVTVRIAFTEDGKPFFDVAMTTNFELGNDTYRDNTVMRMLAGDDADSFSADIEMTTDAKIDGDVETVAFVGTLTEEINESRRTAEDRVVISQIKAKADIDGKRITERKGEDFTSAMELGMDMTITAEGEDVRMKATEFANIASRAYAPKDLSGLEVVDLLTLDDETAMSVLAELQSGLMLAVAKAMSLLPQDALAEVIKLTEMGM